MTKEEFRKMAEQTLILDGATGSNLMASGMPRGICTETWVIDHKDIIQNLQRAWRGNRRGHHEFHQLSAGIHGIFLKL